MSCYTTAEIQAKIAKLKAQIALLDDTIDNLSTKTQREYMEDTGQGRIRVDRIKLRDAIQNRELLENQLEMWCNRLSGQGAWRWAPGW
jgi:hypothetical protein